MGEAIYRNTCSHESVVTAHVKRFKVVFGIGLWNFAKCENWLSEVIYLAFIDQLIILNSNIGVFFCKLTLHFP